MMAHNQRDYVENVRSPVQNDTGLFKNYNEYKRKLVNQSINEKIKSRLKNEPKNQMQKPNHKVEL